MKKIGIITYHKHYNYGTMLQAYALQKKIDDLGYESEIINFKNDMSLSKGKLLALRIKRLGIYVKNRKKYMIMSRNKKNIEKKNKLFDEFYNTEMKVGTHFYKNTEELMKEPPLYDGYVVGSDQTWNPYASNGPEAFFLPFVSDSKKKGSYAPSVSVSSLTEMQKEKYKRLLEGFEYLSCREEAGAKIIEEIMERPVRLVLDPTFLLDRNDWKKISMEKKSEEKYILTYFLGEKKEHRNYVKELSAKLQYKIVSIPTTYIEMDDKLTEKEWIGPREFISLIENAEIVCTDSFHGMALSINFNKQFYVFCKTDDSIEESENSRLYNILSLFEISDRMIGLNDEVFEDIEEIDYNEVNHKLNIVREDSINYLKNMLENITK